MKKYALFKDGEIVEPGEPLYDYPESVCEAAYECGYASMSMWGDRSALITLDAGYEIREIEQ